MRFRQTKVAFIATAMVATPKATLPPPPAPAQPVRCALKSILKRSTNCNAECLQHCSRLPPVKRGALRRASEGIYKATSWRSFPAQEWDLDNLPINSSDRYVAAASTDRPLKGDTLPSKVVSLPLMCIPNTRPLVKDRLTMYTEILRAPGIGLACCSALAADKNQPCLGC